MKFIYFIYNNENDKIPIIHIYNIVMLYNIYILPSCQI